MGTRGGVCFIKEKKMLCMYNHFDSYPSYLGISIVELLQNSDIGLLDKNLGLINAVANEDILAKAYNAAGSKESYEGLDMRARNAVYNAAYDGFCICEDPLKVIKSVINGSAVTIRNEPSWPADSLMCEYCYVIDLDKNVFEVYVGFNKSPVNGERFEYLNPVSEAMYMDNEKGRKYWPVRFAGSWNLDELPDLDAMEKAADTAIEKVSKENDAVTYPNYPITIAKYVNGEQKETHDFLNPYDLKKYIREVMDLCRVLNENIVLKNGDVEVFKVDISGL